MATLFWLKQKLSRSFSYLLIIRSDFCGLLVTSLTEFWHIVGVISGTEQFTCTVSNRHHFDSKVPCIHVTLDYFEILSLLCHQCNNILIPAPAGGGGGGTLLYVLYIAMCSPKGMVIQPFWS